MIYIAESVKKRGLSRKFGKNGVYRGKREKSRFVAVNGKNRDIAHTAINSCLCYKSNIGNKSTGNYQGWKVSELL